MNRADDLKFFYALLDELADRGGGTKTLSACSGRMDWPARGVYFFFDPGEQRTDTDTGARIVRVGTHALKEGSKSTLWQRLSQHKGQRAGGGNHRGSIFRLLVGAALMARDGGGCASWGRGSSASRDITAAESPVERRVSEVIGRMPFLCLPVDDEAGRQSLRGVVERNAIALLSNAGKVALDAPSPDWLGMHCARKKVRSSGLWNQNHVDETYDPAFLDLFSELTRATK